AVQESLATTVYNSGRCTSYYFTPTGRNVFAWPWSTGRLVRRLSRFDSDAYTFDAPARPLPLPAQARPQHEDRTVAANAEKP
ncbi:cyclohexanone monooxygenase, partial [Streptomyces sp. NPDC058272]